MPAIDRAPSRSSARRRRMADARGLRSILGAWADEHGLRDADDVILVVEQMATFGGPQSGRDNATRNDLLSMGMSAGIAEGVGAAFSHRTLRPLPQQWKSAYGLVRRRSAMQRAAGVGEESALDRKRRSHRVALMLYPTMGRVSHDVAEAVLIAHWGLGVPSLSGLRAGHGRS